jgi:hypothetical protein
MAAAGRRLTEALVEVDDWLEWRPSSRTVYAYRNGQRIKAENFTATNAGPWLPVRRATIESESLVAPYVTEVEAWNEALGAYEPDTRFQVAEVCFVFTTGQCAIGTQIEQKWDGSTWVNVERTKYSYWDLDPLHFMHPVKSHTMEAWQEGAWVPVERFTFDETTPGGQPFSVIWQVWDGNDWVNMEQIAYWAYITDAQKKFGTIWQEFEDYNGLLLPLQFPEHDLYAWENGSWVSTARYRVYITLEDHRRVRVESMTERAVDGAWIPEGSMTIDYDRAGRPSFMVAQIFRDDEEEEEDGDSALYERYTWSEDGYLATGLQGPLVFGNEIPFFRYSFTWTETPVSTDQTRPVSSFRLHPAFPNPFQSTTTLPYHMEANGKLSVTVFDVLGRQMATLFEGEQSAGAHALTFDASGLSAGIYFIRMEAAGHAQTYRTVLQP